ncbi:MAG: AraC family transcriptional regulator [Acutalibacteraceae bacterium]
MEIPSNRRVRFHFDEVHWQVPLELGTYLLVQAGDLAAEVNYVCMPHIQEVYEISYIVSGRGTFVADGGSYPVERGTLFLNRIGEEHNIFTDNDDPIRYFYLGFRFRDACLTRTEYRSLKDFFDTAQPRMVTAGTGIQDDFLRLFNNLITADLFSATMLETCVHQILVDTYRQFTHAARPYSQPADGKKRLLYEMIHYIDENCEDLHALQKLSEPFGYSYSTLASLFSQGMGETLKGYYTRQRFERAAQLLDSGMSVTQISERLGYRSIHAFSRAFSRQYGESPLEYRKTRRGITGNSVNSAKGKG